MEKRENVYCKLVDSRCSIFANYLDASTCSHIDRVYIRSICGCEYNSKNKCGNFKNCELIKKNFPSQIFVKR